MKRTLSVFVALIITAVASACLWDYDTVAQEVNPNFQTVDAIVGRFDRNPPLYYEMRLARVTKELQKDPSQLALYDDAGVACERLGRSTEAIEWMRLKKAQLDKKPDKDQLYRYHANIGTFYAHRWMKEGKKDDLTEIKMARDHISKAIEINPNAHFGREKYQFYALQWIIKKPVHDGGQRMTLSDYIREQKDRGEEKKDVRGLTGLIVLGNAWESPDVFHALVEALSWARLASISEMAHMRYEELVSDGKKSALGEKLPRGGLEALTKKAETDREYNKLRENADQYHENRTSFMLANLKAGKHPDVDKDFWNGYEETPRYKVPTPLINWTPNHSIFVVLTLVLIGVVGIPWFGIRWLIKRKRQKCS